MNNMAMHKNPARLIQKYNSSTLLLKMPIYSERDLSFTKNTCRQKSTLLENKVETKDYNIITTTIKSKNNKFPHFF